MGCRNRDRRRLELSWNFKKDTEKKFKLEETLSL